MRFFAGFHYIIVLSTLYDQARAQKKSPIEKIDFFFFSFLRTPTEQKMLYPDKKKCDTNVLFESPESFLNILSYVI